MLVECGYVRATAGDGTEYTFAPSFSRIASLGSPKEIVSLYAGLHGPRAAIDATYVLACLCEQDDPLPLIGWDHETGHHPGTMPPAEQITIARHLMQHGIVGKAKPGTKTGDYSDSFNAAEYIAAACVHLGLSRADAENLSMTEFQIMFEMKFPDSKAKEMPGRGAYKSFMAKIKGGVCRNK
ncbi:MAG: hypothetical protein KBG00_07975 [Rhodoferax sp.]|jgi:hypothetical protein|uniref:DUF6246 family protein n=1 Tax=Rhodoferax sp. TaxID=50421 RepID=UPI001B77E8EC|nr:DUF6246 family protein [Rhodoferax sp.]MBP9148706.1 hypothetical protein [Rhodoferax sp.]MBP9736260.1 hypothetical protein [Rhodoferax sp.]